MFEKLPPVPDHPALERGILELWEREGTFERVRERNRGGPRFSLHGRADHGQQPDGRPPPGPGAEGRLPALQGATRVRDAVPERLRLPGPARRGRGREVARTEFQTRDRDLRPGRVRCEVPGTRRALRRRDDGSVEAARHVDGLGQRLLHLLGHEHRVHLALPQGGAPPRLAVQGPPLHPVVPPLRHVTLEARAGRRGELRGARASLARGPLPAARTRRGVARRLDDDAVDAAGQCRSRRQARRRVRAPRRRRLGRRGALSRRALRRAGQGRGARRPSLRGPVRPPTGAGRRRAPRHPLGRGLARTRERGSSTSPPDAAPRTSSSHAVPTCRC